MFSNTKLNKLKSKQKRSSAVFLSINIQDLVYSRWEDKRAHMHTHSYYSKSWSIRPTSLKTVLQGEFYLHKCQCISVQPWIYLSVYVLPAVIPRLHRSTICLSVGLCWRGPPLEARLAAQGTMTALCPHGMHAVSWQIITSCSSASRETCDWMALTYLQRWFDSWFFSVMDRSGTRAS